MDNMEKPSYITEVPRSSGARAGRGVVVAAAPDSPTGQPLLTPPITRWSVSSLTTFEQCPYHLYLTKVQNIPEPTAPAARRGLNTHAAIDRYLKSGARHVDLDNLSQINQDFFRPRVEQLRKQHAKSEVMWDFDRFWSCPPSEGEPAWVRMILDTLVMPATSDEEGVIIDYKTGRRDGNEMKHTFQAMVYAIGYMARVPEADVVTTSFWYLDHHSILDKHWTRTQLIPLKANLEERAERMTNAVHFPPQPSLISCRWCPHGQSGVCAWAAV